MAVNHSANPQISPADSEFSDSLSNFAATSTAQPAFLNSPLLREADGDFSAPIDSSSSNRIPPSFSRSPKGAQPSDPTLYPDNHRPRSRLATSNQVPPLTADSTSSSTRSSAAYPNFAILSSVNDQNHHNHVHVVSTDDEQHPALRPQEEIASHMFPAFKELPQPPADPSQSPSRWSVGTRSRSSSTGQHTTSHQSESVRNSVTLDMTWGTVDERDELGISEDDTDADDDHLLAQDDENEDMEEEERTAAVVLAEMGTGLIVHGDGVPVQSLQAQPGTTHLIIGSSSTPNAMPSFLTSTIPLIRDTLLALDISANFLGALPPCLALCSNLEELNIASNPLRVIPVFLCDLVNLRVLIADCTGISTLPESLAELDKLHTLSIRRNKMYSLPSWLCLLPALQTLYVDGNSFQGPWKALVEPLLAKTPSTPIYPLSTPTFPLPSASTTPGTPYNDDHLDEFSDPSSSDAGARGEASARHSLVDEEDSTITVDQRPSPFPPHPPPSPSGSSLLRTRTAPNRNFSRSKSSHIVGTDADALSVHSPGVKEGTSSTGISDREVRKMKSTGELRRVQTQAGQRDDSELLAARPGFHHATTTNVVESVSPPLDNRPSARRFASVGPATAADVSPARSAASARPALSQSMWQRTDSGSSGHSSISTTSPPHKRADHPDHDTVKPKQGRKWGFFKKMSMGKMNSHLHPSPPATSSSRPHTPTQNPQLRQPPLPAPQLDVRISGIGTLNGFHPPAGAAGSPPRLEHKSSRDMLKVIPPGPSPFLSLHNSPSGPSTSNSNLLAPPSPLARPAKRRSFLPIDGAANHAIQIPDSAAFIPNVMATNDEDRGRTPSPQLSIEGEQWLKKEEERTKEAYQRALRSLMAYLKDMNDLSSQQQQLQQAAGQGGRGSSVYDETGTRSRRPTVVDRELSLALSGTTLGSESHQRSSDASIGGRGSSSQTLSVATTDSSGSGNEDRKSKDDKAKRAAVVREIIETERTYVKDLGGLVDIYIKPAAAPANVLAGVGSSSKETVLPANERKIVFGGVESLYFFHRDSFLPSLEVAAAPLMKSAEELKHVDADGHLSLTVSKAVGNMFVKHAAFMKMYRTYINNFDHSVTRVKYWTSDRSAQSPAALTPSSSTAHLVGITTAAMAGAGAGGAVESLAANGAGPALTSSQKKRIKAYLKRCRLNPRHTQLNLDGYLLLPVQRVPRYRLMLEELLRHSPPTYEYMDDPVDKALAEISLLANSMNEGKRETETQRKLVQWQQRIRGKFPSPLVQPHRKLIMDGSLLLTRVVRKAVASYDIINAQGDSAVIQVDCLAPELTPRSLVGILCNDLLVLCRDPSEGKDLNGPVDLWAVLRMQTLPQPASIVHGNALRLVDSKAILYFDAPSPSDALNWFRAINLHIPASKS